LPDRTIIAGVATRGEIDPWIALSLVVLPTAKIEAAQRSSAASVPARDDDAPGSTDQREKRV
jgi:hypothetical protein